ncbi:hypothetical protein MIND_00187600 [Mycena indigotica]|uniref:Uncharacterized protein n=1 Tax=Mycena indigotica TaxID=2126181 RepID=A0A8H6T7S2_9AGAR|nr:uncharacterized protein MIND_00187600 [Mycena indigotica]KAF7311771.1 hypothetical protein MIND_00187600 [Mycena indigotica]
MSLEPFNPNLTLGIYQVGVLCSFLLLGIACTQAHFYYTHYQDDSVWLKLLVAFICLTELGQAASLAASLYSYTISIYGQNIDPFLKGIPLSLGEAALLAGLIAPTVQSFFAYRIMILAPHAVLIACTIWFLALGQICLSTTMFIQGGFKILIRHMG